MDEGRRKAMRRAHAKQEHYCTCGKVVHGNGGRASHKRMHEREKDGHRWMTYSAWIETQRPGDPT